jgi:hypothetical protein
VSKSSSGSAASSNSTGDRPGVDRPIKIGDIEARLRSVQSDVTKVKDSTVGAGIAAGGVIALVILIMAFLIGKKIGTKKYSFVEIRRH